MRGFACVGLVNPKSPANIGGALRAAGCYGAGLVVIAGQRPQRISRLVTDTMKAYRSIPTQLVDDVFDAIPYDCVPVAVDLLPNARPLPEYVHPERAFYIFGAEDATLGKAVTARCRDSIIVPTNRCMNLAATVNVILYDRIAKRGYPHVPRSARPYRGGNARQEIRVACDAAGSDLSPAIRCGLESAGAE